MFILTPMKTVKKKIKVQKEKLLDLMSKKLMFAVALPEWRTGTAILKKNTIQKRNKFH